VQPKSPPTRVGATSKCDVRRATRPGGRPGQRMRSGVWSWYLEAQAAVVELHAVIRGDHDHRAVEEPPALHVVEDPADQGVDVVRGREVARPELPLDGGPRGDGHREGVVWGRVVRHHRVVEEEAEDGAPRIPVLHPLEPLLGQGQIPPARSRIGRDRLQAEVRHAGEGCPVETHHPAVHG
jgi:hypothetical protein